MVRIILGKDAPKPADLSARVNGKQQAKDLAGGKAVQGFSHSETDFLPNELNIKNPLVAAAYLCFSHHLPLILSPDVIWNTIMQGVSTHVKRDSDKYHDKFVSPEETKSISITKRDDTLQRYIPAAWGNAWDNDAYRLTGQAFLVRQGSPRLDSVLHGTKSKLEKTSERAGVTPPVDQRKLGNGNKGSGFENPSVGSTDDISASIRTKLGLSAIEAFNMSFTAETVDTELSFTAAKDDKELAAHVAHAIVFMDVVRNYFNYRVITLSSIPSIEIRGTKQDWSRMRTALSLLELIGLGKWKAQLNRVLQGFENAFDNINSEAAQWNNFFQVDASKGKPTKISGWIGFLFLDGVDVKLNPAAMGEMPVDPVNFPSGLCETPFEWSYYGKDIDMLFRGGLVGVVIDESTNAVAPQLGWLVTEKERKEVIAP